MTKRKKILICCILAALLTIVTIIPIFAVDSTSLYLTYPPSDLGSSSALDYDEGYNKYYIKIVVNSLDEGENICYVRQYVSSSSTNIQSVITITKNSDNNTLSITYNRSISSGSYSFFAMPVLNINIDSTEYYIPVYIYNGNPYYIYIPNGITYYKSSTTDSTVIQAEAYRVGYANGYNNGFDEGLLEGQNIQQYTNLVGYVEQLIGQFTGSAAAQYITPIAIVLVVLFVYFLFIRFLLSLVKAKGIIKTCDIIMIVACIIMLVVMYSPMLDFTIKTEQIYTSEEDTETVQVRNSNIYVVPTETGDIYFGPVGTAIVTKSETIEEVYKITKDIETEAIAYEKD